MHPTPSFQWPSKIDPESQRAANFDWGTDFYFLSNPTDGVDFLADLDRSSGRQNWIVMCPAEAYIAPHFKSTLLQSASERPDVDIFYTDDIDLTSGPGQSFINNRPNYDPTLLASLGYIGSAIIVRASAFAHLGGVDWRWKDASVFDLVLRASASGLVTCHIPQVLFAYPSPGFSPTQQARMSVAEAQLGGRGFEVLPGLTPDSLEVRRKFDIFPAVTILVLEPESYAQSTFDQLSDNLIKSGWPMEKIDVIFEAAFEILFHSRLNDLPVASVNILTDASQTQVETSARANQLWNASKNEHVVFLHGAPGLQPNWLQALLTFSIDLAVGVAFGRCLQSSANYLGAPTPHEETLAAAPVVLLENIQHEGLNIHRGVFATRRTSLEKVNGLDVRFGPELSVLDFCLRLNMLGARIVYTPFCCGPGERSARPAPRAPLELGLFFARWGARLDSDPTLQAQLDLAAQAPEESKAHRWFDALF